MKPLETVLTNREDVLIFLKSRFPIYHLSNVFFRDLQYGIRTYLEAKNLKVSYDEAEGIARRFVEDLERAQILKPIDHQTWTVTHPEFRTPQRKPAAPARPAAPAAAAPRIAAPAAAQPPASADSQAQ